MNIASSQGQVKKENKAKTKMSSFVSEKGVIIKFEDYNLLPLKSPYGSAKTKIRKIISRSTSKFFFQITKKGKYSSDTASIAYEDIIEILGALNKLDEQSKIDVTTVSDYLENKFVTDDGFRVGYYISKKKVHWYIQLDDYGSNNTVFIKEYEKLFEVFKNGKEKIEELKE